jgi:sugar lactone lactonase YvrE
MALVALVAAVFVLSPAAAPPLKARVLSLPRSAVVGTTWQARVALKRGARPYAGAASVRATGPQAVAGRVRKLGKGVFALTLTFPLDGRFTVSVTAGGRRVSLGSVVADVRPNALVRDPFAVAADASGLVIGQNQSGQLLRVASGSASVLAPLGGVVHVYASPTGALYALQTANGRVLRVDPGSGATTEVGLFDGATSVAADASGNVYVAIYAGRIVRVAPGGVMTTIAGTGEEGYSGDGGPATAAKLFHPHGVAVGADGAVYISDTENRRIRRVAGGVINTVGGDVGITVSVAVAGDGTVYSADVVRGGLGGGVVQIAPGGATTRILSSEANGVAVGPDGTVYANQQAQKRVRRLVSPGVWATVIRGA